MAEGINNMNQMNSADMQQNSNPMGKKSKKWIWVLILSLIVVIAAALAVYFLVFRKDISTGENQQGNLGAVSGTTGSGNESNEVESAGNGLGENTSGASGEVAGTVAETYKLAGS